MIEASDAQLVRQCLEAYQEWYPKAYSAVPSEMQQDEWQQHDWMQWKLMTSRLKEADVIAFEQELPFTLPPLFRAFIASYYVPGMDFGDFYLPALPSDDPLKNVRHYLLEPDLWAMGYAQFAGGQCGDPVCFDLQSPTPDGDFAVIAINHDWIEPGDWPHRERVELYVKREASSFREFFTRLCLGDQSALRQP